MKKKLWHEDDDDLQALIDQDIEDYEKYNLKDFKGIYHKNNGEETTDPLDQGRNCPRCAGRLRVKEITERNQNVYLYCSDCGLQVFAEDIDEQTEIIDKMYRTIPDDVFLKWERYSKEQRQKS